MNECIFCKLANGEIPTDMVYENDLAAAFSDADPQAPVHVLVVPKEHIQSFSHLSENSGALLDAMREAIHAVVEKKGLEEGGYRIVINTGEDGGQTVPHLHMHILGGRSLQWPPG